MNRRYRASSLLIKRRRTIRPSISLFDRSAGRRLSLEYCPLNIVDEIPGVQHNRPSSNPPTLTRVRRVTDFAKSIGEPINMTWSQELAAYWSIAWPSWLLYFLLASAFVNKISLDSLETGQTILFLGGNLIIFLSQGILALRLVRKDHRSFWIGVLHEGESPKRNLTLRECTRVSFQLLWPQATFLFAVFLLSYSLASSVATETMRSINALMMWLRILLVGPLAVRCAIYANYSRFGLQA
jgi:hypothetical protein